MALLLFLHRVFNPHTTVGYVVEEYDLRRDIRLHIFIFVKTSYYSTCEISKESIGKFLIGNRFHVTLRIISPEICKQCLRVKR